MHPIPNHPSLPTRPPQKPSNFPKAHSYPSPRSSSPPQHLCPTITQEPILQFIKITTQVDPTSPMFSLQNSISKLSLDTQVDEAEIKAPRQRPLESHELPPEFKLEQSELAHDRKEERLLFEKGGISTARKGSLDLHFSILGFITRKLQERSRQRALSEDLLGDCL